MSEARLGFLSVWNALFLPLLITAEVLCACRGLVQAVVNSRMISPVLRAVFCLASSVIAQHAPG